MNREGSSSTARAQAPSTKSPSLLWGFAGQRWPEYNLSTSGFGVTELQKTEPLSGFREAGLSQRRAVEACRS